MEYSILIKKEDLDLNELVDESAVRYDGLIKISKNLLHKRIAKANAIFCKHLVAKIIEVID